MNNTVVHFHDRNGKLLGTAVAINENGVARVGFSTVHKNDIGNRKLGKHIATQRANSDQAMTTRIDNTVGKALAARLAIGSMFHKAEGTNREDSPNSRAVEVLSNRGISDFQKVAKF